jgi:hypothetical protein
MVPNPWRLLEEEEETVFLEVWCMFKEIKLQEFCHEEMVEEMKPPRQRGAVYVTAWGIAPGIGEAIPRKLLCEVFLWHRTFQNTN